MMKLKKIMILGGYGTFGSRIASSLCQLDCTIIIAGRNRNKAEKLLNKLKQKSAKSQLEVAIFDAHKGLKQAIERYQPTLVIHTCGPFQGQTTNAAQTCIAKGVHYIDLADGRSFVQAIAKHDNLAKKNKVIAITAASTVPSLSSAVLEHYLNGSDFSEYSFVKYGITPGQKTDRGLATTKAVLSYIGKPIKLSIKDSPVKYGWQDTYIQDYPLLGKRLMGNCEIPDLDLLQKCFPIKEIQFSAGMESKILHISIWFLSWLVRLKLPLNLPKHAKGLNKLGRFFDILGSHDGGMHVHMQGKDRYGKALEKTWYIVAKNGDGPMIPAIPAVIMAKKIINNEFNQPGVHPCIGMISLQEYLHELAEYDIEVFW